MNAHSRPWTLLSLPLELTHIRAMLSQEEKQYLTWLTAERFEGWGAILDLGPWLGGSSAMLAEGLKRRGKRDKIFSFDLFSWDPRYMEAAAHENLKEGDDFRHLFVREVGDYISWIEPEKLDLINASWNGGPIEILFVDAAKTWALTNAILRGFGPHLVPGRSRVVLQDFRHYTAHWLPLIFDSRPDIWKEAESVEDGSTVTFIPLKPLDGLAGIDPDYAEESFSLESAEQLLRSRMARASPSNRRLFLQGLYKKYLIDPGPLDEVRKLRAEVLAEGITSEELALLENLEISLVPQGWRAYARNDYRTARMLAERCITASGARPLQSMTLLGMSLLRLGDLDGARSCIEEVATRYPDFLQARLHRAEVALVEGRYDEAEADALQGLEGSQGDEGRIEYAMSILEQAWNGAGRTEQAVDALTGLISALGESPTLLTHLAREQFNRGRRDEATQTVKKALRKAPRHKLASRLHDEWTNAPATTGNDRRGQNW